jgi:hypothetical protein
MSFVSDWCATGIEDCNYRRYGEEEGDDGEGRRMRNWEGLEGE